MPPDRGRLAGLPLGGALLRAGNRKEMCMACFTGRYPTALYEHAAEIGRKEDKNR